uniref:NADPH:quinone oxidoreductase family protein n=1 Tax=Cupriavidus necator TaxID=106590 RepID=UPI003FA46447
MPADDEMLVQVQAAGLNFADTLTLAGSYQEKQSFPFIPGAELCGTVMACGFKVERFKPGERVMGQVAAGAYAEYAVLHPDRAARVPPIMPADLAAGFYIPYGTALCALRERGRLKSGETALILGAAGAVGQAAVQVARALGASVVAATGGSHHRDAAMKAGAHHHVTYDDGDLRDAVMQATEGRGVDVVLDTVGGMASLAALRTLRFEGRLVVIGFTGGRAAEYRGNHILVKNIDIVGCYWGPYQQRRPEETQAAFATLADWHARGLLKPHVAAHVGLDEVGAALERLQARCYAGKVIVNIRHQEA